MANIIDMPKLSDTMTVGTLVKWLKNEGDVVKSGTMLAEVETDKATMELESFFDGTILKIFAPPGSQVAIGAPLCAIGKPGEKVDAPAPKSAPAAPAAETKKEPTPEQAKAYRLAELAASGWASCGLVGSAGGVGAAGTSEVAAIMTVSTQEAYAQMMISGGRSPDGNRYQSEWDAKRAGDPKVGK